MKSHQNVLNVLAALYIIKVAGFLVVHDEITESIPVCEKSQN